VAGDYDGDWVCGAGASDSADCLWHADAVRNLRVGDGLARGDFPEGLPNFLLEGCALQVERQVKPGAGLFNETDYTGDKAFVVAVAANQTRPGETVLEVAGELGGIIAQQDRANAFVGRRDEDGTEGTFADRKTDRRARAAVAEGGRAHAEHCEGFFVEAAV